MAAAQELAPMGDRPKLPHSTALIDRYILKETAKPLLISLAVVMVALLLERILRLFDLLANHGGPFELVIRMAANLVPHYLGLALPAAFFISMFVVVAKFGDDNELDALQTSGLSIARITRPFLWLGAGLMVFSILLFGFIQPYSRYAYRAIFHVVTNAAWDATVPQASFVDAGQGLTITADQVDPTGRGFQGIFVHQKREGEEMVTTAASGRLALSDDRERILVTLQNGTQMRASDNGPAQVLRFGTLTLDRDFPLEAPPFRPRGGTERELTLLELWEEMHAPMTLLPKGQLAAEFHSRIVRGVTLVLLPLLAIPMGMAAKRARRGQGVALAAVILVMYHHAIQLGESMADVGRVDPSLGIWVPFVLFSVLCFWLFHRAQVRPGENPFAHAFDRIDTALHGVGRLLPRRRRRTPAPPSSTPSGEGRA